LETIRNKLDGIQEKQLRRTQTEGVEDVGRRGWKVFQHEIIPFEPQGLTQL